MSAINDLAAGRSIFDGPTYGNWGGKNWSAGLDVVDLDELTEEQKIAGKVIDWLDALTEPHDYAFDRQQKSSKQGQYSIHLQRAYRLIST